MFAPGVGARDIAPGHIRLRLHDRAGDGELAVTVSATAEVGASASLFLGPSCDPCGPHHVLGLDEDSGVAQVDLQAALDVQTVSALVTDAAGNTSPCVDAEVESAPP